MTTETPKMNLLPCPFCNAQAEIYNATERRIDMKIDTKILKKIIEECIQELACTPVSTTTACIGVFQHMEVHLTVTRCPDTKFADDIEDNTENIAVTQIEFDL